MSFFFGRKTRIPPNAAFRLTQEGREKLQEFSGDPKSRILVALETHGSSDISEIANASGLNRGQVERFIPILVRGGYISYISGAAIQDEV